MSEAIARFAQAAQAGARTACVTTDGKPGLRWWTDENGVPHTAIHYEGAVMLSKIAASICFRASAVIPSHASTSVVRTDCCCWNSGAGGAVNRARCAAISRRGR